MSAGKGDKLRKGANLKKFRASTYWVKREEEAKRLAGERMKPVVSKRRDDQQGGGA